MEPSRFKQLRLYFGLDQAAMARWFGTNQSVISLWETEKRTPPYIEAARRFGVSVDWLVGLSRHMWGERVTELARTYRASLSSLPDAERAPLSEGPPSQRVAHLLAFLQAGAPDLITPEYFALLLSLTPETLEAVLSHRTGVSHSAALRLADFTGIPERWFSLGNLAEIQPPDFEEYYPVVQQMRAEGITPEDIRRLWNAIKVLRQ